MNSLEIPTCISEESWSDFIEVRRAKGTRAPWTQGAAKRVIHKLMEADKAGFDAQYMIDEAIEKGWSTVYVGNYTPRVNRQAKETAQYLASREQTAEQRAASEEARRRVMSAIKRVS